MSNHSLELEYDDSERRQYFRINDRIAMVYVEVSQSDLETALNDFEERSWNCGITNRLIHQRELNLPELRAIKQKLPQVASYLESIEEQITWLAQLQTPDLLQIPSEPTHEVNISGTGLSFYCNDTLAPGMTVELRMRLFPSRFRLLAYGKVRWCTHIDSRDSKYQNAVGVEFSRIHDADRELLVKHIHKQQLSSLRARSDS